MISTINKLTYLLTGFRNRFISSFIIGSIAIAIDTLTLIYFGALVTSISGRNELIDPVKSVTGHLGISSNLQVLFGILLAMYLIKSVMQIAFNRSISRFAYDIRISLQTRLLKGILVDVPYRQLSANSTALFSNKVLQSTNGFSSELVLQGSIGLLNAATGVSIFAYLLHVNPRPTLFFAVAFSVIGLIFVKKMAKPLKNISNNLHYNGSRLYQVFIDSIYSAKDARVHNLQQNFLDLTGTYLNNVKENQLNYTTIQMIPKATYEILLCLSFFILTVTSDFMSVSTPIDMTQFSIFLLAALKMLPAISQMISAISIYNGNHSSIDVLYAELKPLDELLKEKESLSRDNFECSDNWNSIVLSDVNFSYVPEKPILQNVNLSILQWQLTGICGESGGGKSTILDILLGLLTPDSGSVLINGLNLESCKQSWSAKIGYMSQNLFLIDTSIKANLTVAEPNKPIDIERAKSCLLEVGLKNFASNDGLEFRIGERGVRLSGGQRQRLAIARLLYSQKSVLIFDEPTASLDKHAEEAVIQCIENLKQTRTIIVVSHSERLLRRCNFVYDVVHGVVVKSSAYLNAG